MKVKEVNGDKKQSTLFIYRRIGFSDKLCLSPATAVDDAKNTRIPETKDPRKSSIKKTNWAGLVYWIHHDVPNKVAGECVCFQPRQANRKMIIEPKQTDSKTDFSVFLKALTCWLIISRAACRTCRSQVLRCGIYLMNDLLYYTFKKKKVALISLTKIRPNVSEARLYISNTIYRSSTDGLANPSLFN